MSERRRNPRRRIVTWRIELDENAPGQTKSKWLYTLSCGHEVEGTARATRDGRRACPECGSNGDRTEA